MDEIELDEDHQHETRLYEERSRLMIAYQEMAEAARRLDEAFRDTIQANRLQFNRHRAAFKFYADIKKIW